ncbi:unnamed protein product, partial [Timema podura]|nr:unnamed protein product [Timema podura]
CCPRPQHNALRAICPATVNIVMGVISQGSADRDVRRTAVQCFVIMVQVLNKCTPDQRQIEGGTVLQFYQDSLMELVTGEWHDKSSETLSEVVGALRLLLVQDPDQREQLQLVMVDNHMLDTLITLVEESLVSPGTTTSLSGGWLL